jgi:hypothetical protein
MKFTCSYYTFPRRRKKDKQADTSAAKLMVDPHEQQTAVSNFVNFGHTSLPSLSARCIKCFCVGK